jgi:hypothetical protein
MAIEAAVQVPPAMVSVTAAAAVASSPNWRFCFS